MENLIVLGFDAPEQAYKGFRSLHRLHEAGDVRVRAAAVAERSDTGRIVVREVSEDLHAHGTAAAGAIGAMLGLAAGPVGALVGGATGAVLGSMVDVADTDGTEDLLRTFGRAIPAGSTATLAVVEEATPDAVDAVGSGLGATVLRRPRHELERADAEDDAIAVERENLTRTIEERLHDVSEEVRHRR